LFQKEEEAKHEPSSVPCHGLFIFCADFTNAGRIVVELEILLGFALGEFIEFMAFL
jgi:hypothetical protein